MEILPLLVILMIVLLKRELEKESEPLGLKFLKNNIPQHPQITIIVIEYY